MKNSEKGFSPLILLIAVAAAALLVGGYFLTQKVGLPFLSQKITEKEFAFIEDPLIRKHFTAQVNASAYRIKSMLNLAKPDSASFSEIQIKGDQANFRTWQTENGKESGEMISIAETTYIKDYSDNKWWKQTLKPEKKKEAEKTVEVAPKDLKEEYETEKQKLTYKKIGEEPCPNINSLSCYQYEEVNQANPSNKRLFWFDKKQLLLRQEEVGLGGFKSTNQYAYDNININAPSPTKEVPEGKNIYEYLYSGPAMNLPSQEELNQWQQQLPSLPPLPEGIPAGSEEGL